MSKIKFKKDPLVLINIMNDIYREYGLYLTGYGRLKLSNKNIYIPTGPAGRETAREFNKRVKELE